MNRLQSTEEASEQWIGSACQQGRTLTAVTQARLTAIRLIARSTLFATFLDGTKNAVPRDDFDRVDPVIDRTSQLLTGELFAFCSTLVLLFCSDPCICVFFITVGVALC